MGKTTTMFWCLIRRLPIGRRSEVWWQQDTTMQLPWLTRLMWSIIVWINHFEIKPKQSLQMCLLLLLDLNENWNIKLIRNPQINCPESILIYFEIIKNKSPKLCFHEKYSKFHLWGLIKGNNSNIQFLIKNADIKEIWSEKK